MLEQVESKLSQFKSKQKDEYYKKKNDDLVQWGLTNASKGKGNSPVIVTDEEYEALSDANDSIKTYSKNKVASVLNTCVIITPTAGVISGAVLWLLSENLGFVWFTLAVVVSVLMAVMFKGVAEIITLLQQLLRSSSKKQEEPPKDHKAFPDKQPEVERQFKNSPPVHFTYPSSTGSTTTTTTKYNRSNFFD